MAAANASQLTDLRPADDRDSNDEKTAKVEALTLSVCQGPVGCSSEVAMAAWGVTSYMDKCAGGVFTFCLRCWIHDSGGSGAVDTTYSALASPAFAFCHEADEGKRHATTKYIK